MWYLYLLIRLYVLMLFYKRIAETSFQIYALRSVQHILRAPLTSTICIICIFVILCFIATVLKIPGCGRLI